MDTKAIRDALARESAKYPCECEFSPAPTWLQQLLDENERLQNELQEQQEISHNNHRTANKYLYRTEQLQADKAVAVTALQKVLEIDGYMFVKEALERIESGEKGLPDKEKPRT